MLGTDRYRVIAWENKGQIPDAEHRARLAELSGLPPDTFLPPHVGGVEISTDDLEARVATRVEERMREERQREIRELRSELRRELRREVKQEVKRLREAS